VDLRVGGDLDVEVITRVFADEGHQFIRVDQARAGPGARRQVAAQGHEAADARIAVGAEEAGDRRLVVEAEAQVRRDLDAALLECHHRAARGVPR
jgi:hypothetical protein